ncbi:MAG: sulfotransferase [Nitrospirota bacterium]|nr:sulfotransferase [Nitrospirota bacterium]
MIGQIDTNYIRSRPLKLWGRLLSYGLFEGRPLTTRGRWINPLVFALFALEKRLPRLRMVEKPVFIIGTGRSGTTILGILLSMHRDVGFLNEPKALWHAIYPREDLVGSYDRGPAQYRLGAEEVTPEMIAAAHRIYGAYLFSTCSRRVVDKYPELIFRVPFVRRLFLDARFLFLVRNGWDTCHSIDLWSKRLGTHAGDEQYDWWGVDNRKWKLLVEQVAAGEPDFGKKLERLGSLERHTDMAALEWILTMREGLRLSRELPEVVKTVRYEDLVLEQEKELSAILEFCELPRDEKFFAYGKANLSLAPAKKPFPLDESLRDEFFSTMAALGYF